MWIRCPNGLDTLVHHEDHIRRLLAEGGVEIPDPTLPSEQATQEEAQPVTEEVASEPVVRRRGRSKQS